MGDFFKSLVGLEYMFFLFSLVGGIGFLFQIVLQFVLGGAGDMDVDMVDMDVSTGHDVSGHGDVGFKLLSFQSITAFFMMFGLTGLTLSKSFDQPALVSFIGGFFGGYASMWIVAKLFELSKQLSSSGTLELNNTLGLEGTVYLTIKPGEEGKVQLPVQNRLHEFNAISESAAPIPTGSNIRVVGIKGGNILVVEKA